MAEDMNSSLESATLGGGCFWCIEAIFAQQMGVKSVVSGYAGGHDSNPDYKDVCSGTTGHAEVIQVTFDPKVISFDALLDLFWRAHDPTTLNRQGNDVGTQYRSAIYYHNEDQKASALMSIEKAQKFFDEEIVTELAPLDKFFPAEGYHQDFYTNNPEQGYCSFVIRPKLAKLGLKP
jgi:peptide-methionine (S)-S-oxide reductase